MGSGKNGTFDKEPDWQQWAVLAVQGSESGVFSSESGVFSSESGVGSLESGVQSSEFAVNEINEIILGKFIAKWFSFFKCETYTLLLDPIESHGLWDGKKAFGDLPAKSEYEGPIAVLTRATIRPGKLKYFWQNVAPVAAGMITAKGFMFSAGVGEIPWIKQATFSVWHSKEDMKAFAYGMKAHKEVIQKTRKENWYSEDMFTRFRIIKSIGTLRGKNPLGDL